MKSFAVLIAQVVIVIGLSGVVLVSVGPEIYLVMAAICTILAAGLMVAADPNLEKTFSWLTVTALLAFLLGLFWPTLPCVVAVGAAMNRRGVAETKDNPPNAGPGGT